MWQCTGKSSVHACVPLAIILSSPISDWRQTINRVFANVSIRLNNNNL